MEKAYRFVFSPKGSRAAIEFLKKRLPSWTFRNLKF